MMVVSLSYLRSECSVSLPLHDDKQLPVAEHFLRSDTSVAVVHHICRCRMAGGQILRVNGFRSAQMDSNRSNARTVLVGTSGAAKTNGAAARP